MAAELVAVGTDIEYKKRVNGNSFQNASRFREDVNRRQQFSSSSSELRACLHEGGGTQIGEVIPLGGAGGGGGKKITLLYMQSYNPAIRGTLSQDYWMVT